MQERKDRRRRCGARVHEAIAALQRATCELERHNRRSARGPGRRVRRDRDTMTQERNKTKTSEFRMQEREAPGAPLPGARPVVSNQCRRLTRTCPFHVFIGDSGSRHRHLALSLASHVSHVFCVTDCQPVLNSYEHMCMSMVFRRKPHGSTIEQQLHTNTHHQC